MKMRRFAWVAILTVALLSGCAPVYKSPAAVRDHVSGLTATPYTDESGFVLGRTALILARTALDVGGVETPDVLDDLKDLQVGVYRGQGVAEAGRRLSPGDFRAYEPVFAVQSKRGEDVLLLTRVSGSSVKQVLLVVDGRQKLTVVLVRGDLGEIIEKVTEFALTKADRTDLTPLAMAALEGGAAMNLSGAGGSAGPVFLCRGNEPFWNFRVAGDVVTLDSLVESVGKREFRGSWVVDDAAPDAFIWDGVSSAPDALRLRFRISEGTCRDTMSDETPPTDHHVEVEIVGELRATGCCRVEGP